MSFYSTPFDMFNSINSMQYGRNQLLPRVNSVQEVEKDPICSLNSEKVYLHSTDNTLIYIKRIDSNGKSTITRYRYYEDPEPTEQEINDSRYITIEEFNKFKGEVLNSLNNKNYIKGKNVNGNRPNKEDV